VFFFFFFFEKGLNSTSENLAYCQVKQTWQTF